ncbi:MAG: M16 family metallopeptidase [Bacillota bacterium]
MLTTLPNGLTVISEEIPHVRSVAVGLWARAGSRYEEPSRAGLSHFLEHMFFKGSTNRTAKQIAEAIDAVGGQLNAFTGKEHSCFYARVLDEHFVLALDILSDMLMNPLFAQDDIERERNVILEEINSYEDTPDDLIHDLILEAFWEDHPLGRSILGPEEVVKGFEREQVRQLYEDRYTPDKMVVAVAGRVDPQMVADEVQARLGAMRGRGRPADERAPRPAAGRLFREKDSEQVHLCLAGPGQSASEDRAFYAAQVLSTMVGGGSSSRLFQRIREERGLTYSIYTYTSSYQDGGLLATYAGAGPAQSRQVLDLILEEFGRFRREGPDQEELERACAQLKAGVILGLESTTSRMMRLGRLQLTLGRQVSPDDVISRIDAVTRDDVMAVAADSLDLDRLAVAALGPSEALADLEQAFALNSGDGRGEGGGPR